MGQSTEIFSSNAKIKNLKSFLIEAVGAVTKGPIGYGKNVDKKSCNNLVLYFSWLHDFLRLKSIFFLAE